MLTYILPLEGGGLCVCILVYLFFFTVADEASIECWWVLPWNVHRHNKIGVSFNPRAATDISGSVKTCLWLDDWQESVRSKLSRDPESRQSSLFLPLHCSLPLFSVLLRCSNKNWEGGKRYDLGLLKNICGEVTLTTEGDQKRAEMEILFTFVSVPSTSYSA